MESTDELLLTAFLNETSRITYALIDINLWGADVAQLEAQDLLGCQHSPAEGFLRCLAVKTKDCTNDCALQVIQSYSFMYVLYLLQNWNRSWASGFAGNCQPATN